MSLSSAQFFSLCPWMLINFLFWRYQERAIFKKSYKVASDSHGTWTPPMELHSFKHNHLFKRFQCLQRKYRSLVHNIVISIEGWGPGIPQNILGYMINHNYNICIRFEVFTAVTMMNTVLWDIKTPVRTSQETQYVSATEPSQLMLCKIWGFHGDDYEECRLLGYKTQFVPHRRHIPPLLQRPSD
jgi:hypothetical protein